VVMTDSIAVSRSFRVGRYTCTLSTPRPERGAVLAMVAEWSPHVPTRLSSTELRAYRAGRDAFVAELAAQIGGTAAVVEVE
jgi:hypothetical protein